MPKVSVAMSVYNGAEYLRASIDSVLTQTFDDFEFIIVDDGSTDHSAEIIRSYTDSRIVLRQQSNQGVATALNHALRLAHGEYVARQDADDVSLPERFLKQVEFLDAHPEVAVVGTAATLIDRTGRRFSTFMPFVRHDRLVKELKRGVCPLMHGAVMLRRTALAQCGVYNPVFNWIQDVELWLRISQSHRLANMREVLYQFRKHDSSTTYKARMDLRIREFGKTGKLQPQTKVEDWTAFCKRFEGECEAGRWNDTFEAENLLRNAQIELARGQPLRAARRVADAVRLNPALVTDVPARVGRRVWRALPVVGGLF
jgi:glycosyltransferase involved in cell wall biosynthesis